MRQTTVTCDAPGCGKDLTATGNCDDYRIAVGVERLPARSDIVTAMHVPRPLDREYHFCDFACLYKWAVSHD